MCFITWKCVISQLRSEGILLKKPIYGFIYDWVLIAEIGKITNFSLLAKYVYMLGLSFMLSIGLVHCVICKCCKKEAPHFF